MARPSKNNADFFSHDAGMRNHRKIKAIRNKFGVAGYAIWCMLLEHLTGSDGNEFEKSDAEFELIAGDFGVSVTEIRDVISFCIRLELLFENNGFIYSESLNDRLAPVYQKRGVAKELSKKQSRANGKFCGSNIDDPGVSVTEMPQSKVKEITVNTHTVECLCSVFGKKYKTPEERLPAETGFFRDIDAQYPKLLEVYKTDQAIIAQVTAYMRHCDQTKRKRIGTAHKLAETIVQSDWIVLTGGNISPPEVTTTAYSAAEKRRQEWTLEGWEDFYKDQLRDNNFRKHFGYGDLRSSTPMGSNSER